MADEVLTRRQALVATPAELAAAREGRGMSQLDISQRIKLQIKQVDALEQGRWEALPGRSFVRGALRSYGRLLDVDVAPLLESIGGFAEPAPVHGLKPLDASLSHATGSTRRGSPVLWVVACLVAVVALVLYFGSDPDGERVRSWLPATRLLSGESPGAAGAPAAAGGAARSGEGNGSAAATAKAGPGSSPQPSGTGAASPGSGPSSPSVLSALQVLSPKASPSPGGEGASGAAVSGGGSSQVGPGSATQAAPQSATSSATPSAPSATSSAPAATPGSSSAPGASAAATPAPATAAARSGPNAGAAGTKVMQFRAKGDSWIEVRQADGSALHNALLKSGSSIELKGSPPYRLVIGNASKLELTYEGKPQDLTPHTRANDIARLQLQ